MWMQSLIYRISLLGKLLYSISSFFFICYYGQSHSFVQYRVSFLFVFSALMLVIELKINFQIVTILGSYKNIYKMSKQKARNAARRLRTLRFFLGDRNTHYLSNF